MVFAIDFGTTNTCVAVSFRGQETVIASDQSAHQTPSWVAFKKNGVLVGKTAKDYQTEDRENTIYDLKKLIFSLDDDWRAMTNNWPYHIIGDRNQPMIKITAGTVLTLAPEDIIAKLLSEMKAAVERHVNVDLDVAALTVPPYFSPIQRKILEEAAKIAGIFQCNIIDEPIAAAYKHNLQDQADSGGEFLIFHLGGNTVCATVLHFTEDKILQIKENGFAYDTSLGGESFNNILLEEWIKKFEQHGIYIRDDGSVMDRLRVECEKAKKDLFCHEAVRVRIPSILNGKDFHETIWRERFEEITEDLWTKITHVIVNALQRAGTTKQKITKVVLIGGATRMPKVRQIAKEYFGEEKVMSCRNPDETIVLGAVKALVQEHGTVTDRESIPDTPTPVVEALEDEERVEAKGIGIDLGTNFSSIAISRKGKVDILQDDVGDTGIPSCVAFSEFTLEKWVGKEACSYEAVHPKNFICGVKRIIGLKFNNPDLKRYMNELYFDVGEDEGKPIIQVRFNGERRSFSPEDISAEVLCKMKDIAEKRLGKSVTKAVITVPSRFGFNQRKATEKAAEIAGIRVLEMIHEPAAALFAHRLNKPGPRERHVMIVDFGRGTLDIAIFRIGLDGDIYELTTTGDNHLGGEDVTFRLLRHVFKRYKEEHGHNLDKEKAEDKIYYRNLCEEAKKNLSRDDTARIHIRRQKMTISRTEFESVNVGLFDKIFGEVEQALKNTKLTKKQVDNVVLVGGSSRIPKIRERSEAYFKEGRKSTLKVLSSNSPEEDVVKGAAFYSELLHEGRKPMFGVTRMTLGILGEHGVMMKIVERDQPIPCTNKCTFQTKYDQQRRVSFLVYEGDRAMAKDNMLVGRLQIGGIPRRRQDLVEVEITFNVSMNSLEVYGKINGSKLEAAAELHQNSTNLSEEEIERLIEEARARRVEDEGLVEETEKRDIAMQSLMTRARKLSKKGFFQIKSKPINVTAKEVLLWAENNPEAPITKIQQAEDMLQDT